jgi:DNA-binding NtrC family response regulator
MTQNGGELVHLLVADSAVEVREACQRVATQLGYLTRLVDTAEAVRRSVQEAPVSLVLVDLRMPQAGMPLLTELRELRPEAVIVIATSNASLPYAVEAMRHGAYDFLVKPFHLEELRLALQRAAQRWRSARELRHVRERMGTERGRMGMVGDSAAMESLYRLIERAGASASPVLIRGEIGTGKELAARAIHACGAQARLAFKVVDGQLGALPEPEEIEPGTLFIDEVVGLPPAAQARLLKSLRERTLRARLIAATTQDLGQCVEQGRFSRDLYYQLNVFKISVPALRERREDVPLLAAHFLRLQQTMIGRETKLELTESVLKLLMSCDWIGNVRQLENSMARACHQAPDEFIRTFDVNTTVRNDRERVEEERAPARGEILTLAEVERRTILQAVRQCGNDRLEAARLLGIGKTTLYRKLKEYEEFDLGASA